MNQVTHEQQQAMWEKEHTQPFVLQPMDSHNPSSGITKFWEWLQKERPGNGLEGLEMCCGKGRNTIWLAQHQAIKKMFGFDFSTVAITEAKRRGQESGVQEKTDFQVQDATVEWPYETGTFDFAVDCFASTDIESADGRAFAIKEFHRVLKPGGLLSLYTLSTDDSFHAEMMKESPGEQRNSFIHPTTGKFEKIFERDELAELYKDFKVVVEERVEKTATFFGKEYPMKHFWMVFQKF